MAFLTDMHHVALFRPGLWCQIGIARRETDELIGDIGVCMADSLGQAEIGFTLRPQSQGLGLATEAVQEAISLVFEQTQVERIVGVTDTRNAPAVHLLTRVGMRKTETKTAVFRGEPCREHTFVLSRSENG